LPPSIEVLFLLGNQFEDVPVAVTQLHHLRMLSFKQCNLRRLGPTPLSTTLQWLIFSNNQLTALPPWIATLTRVRKLM
jgi:Leucine-rich repeat (LRR) protein